MKATVCKWCDAVDKHYSFQCSQRPQKEKTLKQRKPIERSSKPIKQQGKHYRLWKAARALFVELNPEAKCAMCGGPATDVDHIIKRSVRPDLRYVMTNLQWLCRRCHTLKDNGIY